MRLICGKHQIVMLLGKGVSMKVVEIFNSIDGEGKRAGELTTFIRLFGCNLNCSYCDSRYACENTDENLPWIDKSIEDILAECERYGTRNITVTGGEPLIHKDIKSCREI